jgi:hypothetical protein
MSEPYMRSAPKVLAERAREDLAAARAAGTAMRVLFTHGVA